MSVFWRGCIGYLNQLEHRSVLQSFLQGACGILSLSIHRAIKENIFFSETQHRFRHSYMHVCALTSTAHKQKHKHSYTSICVMSMTQTNLASQAMLDSQSKCDLTNQISKQPDLECTMCYKKITKNSSVYRLLSTYYVRLEGPVWPCHAIASAYANKENYHFVSIYACSIKGVHLKSKKGANID